MDFPDLWEFEEYDPSENILRFNNSDKGKKFRRPHWDKDLWFTWSVRKQRYIYETGGRVGDAVTSASDIIPSMVLIIAKENKMSKNVNYIGTDYEVVNVSYDLNNTDKSSTYTYTYKTDKKIVHGDMVVVEASNGYGLGIAIGDSIPRSLDTDTIKLFNRAKAWVVNVVDTDIHTQRQKATERKAFIMQQLNERREAIEEIAIYKMLAASDPEASKLLEELENLK